MLLKAGLVLLLVLVLGAGAAMSWQHRRYVSLRRNVAHDHQVVWHGGNVFHALVFLRAADGADVLESLRALKRDTEELDATWVYAGKAAFTPLTSSQLGERDWSAVVLLEYPSRDVYEDAADSEALLGALGRFEDVYVHGFRRSAFASAMLPQGLLALRTAQIVRRRPSHFPFRRSEQTASPPRAPEFASRLRAEAELGADAVVIVNLIKEGAAQEQAANRSYGLAMLGAMAEGGYGPLHIGRAVTVEGDALFDSVAIVYYPGVEFFAEMVQSDFFQGIAGDKQLGDTQAVITVPVLDRL